MLFHMLQQTATTRSELLSVYGVAFPRYPPDLTVSLRAAGAICFRRGYLGSGSASLTSFEHSSVLIDLVIHPLWIIEL